MVDNIKILINNSDKNDEYFINCTENLMYINGLIKKVDENIIIDLLRFFLNFENENNALNILDGEETFIEINDGNKVKNFYWRGKYPKNYSNFKEFLRNLE